MNLDLQHFSLSHGESCRPHTERFFQFGSTVHVDNEQNRTKNGFLRNTISNYFEFVSQNTRDLNTLVSVRHDPIIKSQIPDSIPVHLIQP